MQDSGKKESKRIDGPSDMSDYVKIVLKGCYRIQEDLTMGIKKLNRWKHKAGGQRTARKNVARIELN